MLPLPQQIPVEQQPKPIVRIPTRTLGIQPLRPIRRHLPPGSPNRKLDRVGVTHPAREHPDPTLKGVMTRILQKPRQPTRPARGGPSRGIPARNDEVLAILLPHQRHPLAHHVGKSSASHVPVTSRRNSCPSVVTVTVARPNSTPSTRATTSCSPSLNRFQLNKRPKPLSVSPHTPACPAAPSHTPPPAVSRSTRSPPPPPHTPSPRARPRHSETNRHRGSPDSPARR